MSAAAKGGLLGRSALGNFKLGQEPNRLLAVVATTTQSQAVSATIVRTFSRVLAATQSQSLTLAKGVGLVRGAAQTQAVAVSKQAALVLNAVQTQASTVPMVVQIERSAMQPQSVTALDIATHLRIVTTGQPQAVSIQKQATLARAVGQPQFVGAITVYEGPPLVGIAFNTLVQGEGLAVHTPDPTLPVSGLAAFGVPMPGFSGSNTPSTSAPVAGQAAVESRPLVGSARAS